LAALGELALQETESLRFVSEPGIAVKLTAAKDPSGVFGVRRVLVACFLTLAVSDNYWKRRPYSARPAANANQQFVNQLTAEDSNGRDTTR
jgi:hypothetical protein